MTRFVVTLLVRDEIDVIAATIEHHVATGAAMVVVTDNGSVDGTTELLERYVAAGVVSLRHEPGRDYRQSEWVTRMAREACTSFGADWVFNADADEFLWPTGDGARPRHGALDITRFRADLDEDLHDVPADCGQLAVPRFNLRARPGAVGRWPTTLTILDAASTSERGTRLGPKVIHRAARDVVVAQGNHAAAASGLGGADGARRLALLHVPDRGYRQFERKIRNGGAAYAANTVLDEEIGWHWRADYRRLLDGSLPDAWSARQLSVDDVVRGQRAGTLTTFEHLHDHLVGLVGRAVVPDDLRRATGSLLDRHTDAVRGDQSA